MDKIEPKWLQQTNPLEQLSTEQRAEYTQNLEKKLSALYHESHNATTRKQEMILRELKRINRRACENAWDVSHQIPLSSSDFHCPDRKTLPPLYVKGLILVVGVAYFIFRNVFWGSHHARQ